MTAKKSLGDATFKVLALGLASFTLVLVVFYFYQTGADARLAFSKFGIGFILGNKWDPVSELYGVLPELLGTLVTSAIGLLIGVPISLGVAIFLTEIAPGRVGSLASSVVELLAAVPSVVYGFWAVAVFVPLFMRPLEHFLGGALGFLPIFSGRVTGFDVLSAGVILSIMIIPLVSSVSREALLAVPISQREAAYALGATRSEVIRHSVVGYARSGVIGGVFLGFGRALGETMAVTMVIGNGLQFVPSLFSPGQTLASLIANNYGEAITQLDTSALVAAGFVLLLISLVVNVSARLLVRRLVKRGAQFL